jgi:hypothetical protein
VAGGGGEKNDGLIGYTIHALLKKGFDSGDAAINGGNIMFFLLLASGKQKNCHSRLALAINRILDIKGHCHQKCVPDRHTGIHARLDLN